MATLSWPARAPKIIRHRSATCCGVPYEDSHFSSCVCSAGSNWIARLLFGMSEIVAVAVKSVKLFKGHYTRGVNELRAVPLPEGEGDFPSCQFVDLPRPPLHALRQMSRTATGKVPHAF